ncbi:MAG: hypothetical protein HFI26_15455 [Lachnospiraceae bacterium]|jgi:uncharacterized phage protein (TIGR01671 family)|nr:hypothetical protein [Lachnospiraceae bacterium]
MREILFRGKRQDYGVWVEGYYMHNFWNDGGDTIHFPDGGCCEIISETLGQYTGLIDKNGRKIFEGDILKSELGKIGKISFNESHMAFMILKKTENKYYHVEECSGNHMEVIGNIYDNPDFYE